MEVIEFRFLTTTDSSNSKYEAWSRIYEYPIVFKKLIELGLSNESKIHNTSWGFEGCHVIFKNDLDQFYPNTLHSDIKLSDLPNTMYYDITKPIEEKYHNYFDAVINVSTIEEVGFNNIEIIKNLFQQVKPNGYLIITFDYNESLADNEGIGSMNLHSVSSFLKRTIENNSQLDNITGTKSVLPMSQYSHLQCGLLIIKKI
jgi:SAM-dependent methyltransferase